MTEEIRDTRIQDDGMLGPLLAIIVYDSFRKKGVTCFTKPEMTQQLLYMRHEPRHTIQPHIHLPHRRHIEHTREVLFIKEGSIKIDFYAQDKHPITSKELVAGDCVLLISGGHGITIGDEGAALLECKQGPYIGPEKDKIRF